MNLRYIAARIAGQTVKSAIESDSEGFTKALQEIIDQYLIGEDIPDIKLVKAEIANGRGYLHFSGGGVDGGTWEIDFDISQEYADFLKDLPTAVDNAREAYLEGPM
jgi:hypothetical protein